MNLKEEIRSDIKAMRKTLSYDEKGKLDKLIFYKLIETEQYRKAKAIFIFVSLGDEVDTHSIILKAFQDKKQVYVPKVISKKQGMVAVEISSIEELKPGVMGILEPEVSEIYEGNYDIDLAIMPGIAFDKAGGRLGYGGGFYDKFVNKLGNCELIAIGYQFQIINKVPMEAHDVRIHGIITENNFYNFKEDEK